nr:hypothetical protein [uncultured Mediterranean phage uvMED]|tara:strand:- start:5605 stop:6192 length:588 start_codon:yes stop_codon:yes gene_type:complete
MKFPLVVYDNFYERPDEIREYALSLDYNQAGHYPGKRSERIEDLDYEMFEMMSLKFLSLVVEPENGVDSTVLTQFQKIDPMGRGLIHKDGMDSVIAGVVYLDPWPNLGSGTSFYRPNLGLQPTEKSLFYAYEDYNSQFETTTIVKNVYNRCILYDAQTWHSHTRVEEPRLTQVFFVNALAVKERITSERVLSYVI